MQLLPLPQPEIVPAGDDTEPSKFLNPQFKWERDWADDYIGTARGSKIAGLILGRAAKWNQSLSSYFQMCRRNYLLYHNLDPFSGNAASFDIMGQHGEYVELRVNHFRNLLQHMMNLIFAKPDAFKSVALNAEPSSTTAADAFDSYLEQVFKRERALRALYSSGEISLLFGSGFNSTKWDLSRGEEHVADNRGRVINTGGPSIRALSALDSCWDLAVSDWRALPWFIEREAVNKYEFLANHPDHEKAILNAPTIEESAEGGEYAPALINGEESDCIWVWTLHVRPVNSLVLPAGRRVIIVDGADDPIEDDDHPYGEIPIVRTAPMEQLGSLLGYTSAHDVAPCQLFYNVVMRAIATAVAANGVGNITAPRGADLDLDMLIGGCNIVYYNPDASGGGGKPEALNLLELTSEIKELPALVEHIMETLSGVNAAVRGAPADDASGKAIAITIGQTVQFMSGFHQSKTQAGEDQANLLLRLAQKFLSTDQMVQMIGAEKFARYGKLTAEGLRQLARVNAEAVDPTLYTMAGKIQLADKLLDTGAIKTPQEYFEVVRTGNIEVMTNANTSMTRGIRDENSALLRGEDVPVLFFDDDAAHLAEHNSLLDGPEARRNMQSGRYNALIKHMMAHVQQQAQKASPTSPASPVLFPGQAPQGQPQAAQQGAPQGAQPPAQAPAGEAAPAQ